MKEESEKQSKKPLIQRDYFNELLNTYVENVEDDIQYYDNVDNLEPEKEKEENISDSEISETKITELMSLVNN